MILTLLLAGAAVMWMASTELIMPTRRTLQTYHKEWLARPFEHGVTIQRFVAMEGGVPCLLVRPDPAAGVSERGETVRRQLREKGMALRPFGVTHGTLILLHGRRGLKEDLLPVAERFCAVGFRCLIPDLPGHGESPIKVVKFGASDFEASIPSQILEEATARFAYPREPAGLWGMSMGGAFLAKAASRPDSPWKALVVTCSFDSLDAVVKHQVASYTHAGVPFFTEILGTFCKVRGGMPPAAVQPGKWASGISAPVFIAHGDQDTLITLAQGQRLYQAYGSTDKTWTVVKGANHFRILSTEHPLYAEMSAWYLKHLVLAR